MQNLDEQSQMGQRAITKTILVVEDDDSIGSLLVYALSQETSYHPLLVTDGFQALKVMRTLKPCLVITDYRLPQMDGITLYDRVRAQAETADIPTILMSAYIPVDEVNKRQLVSLNKPFELDDLLDTVERLLTQ